MSSLVEAGPAGIERYAAPAGLEAAARLARATPATLLAGGTDLMPQSRSGARAFRPLLLDLQRVEELRGIVREGGVDGEGARGGGGEREGVGRGGGERDGAARPSTLRIGALATVSEILESPLLRAAAPILPEVAGRFASGQVRNSATIGGNLCNASPAGDLVIPLLLLDAEVELASWDGDGGGGEGRSDGGGDGGSGEGRLVRRTVALHDFFTGPGHTCAAPHEILSAVRCAVPARADGFVAAFEKFGTRPALDIAIVSIGIAGQCAERSAAGAGGDPASGAVPPAAATAAVRPPALHDVRVALGAVAPVPLRARRTEAVLEGRPLDGAVIAEAAATAAEECAPISDVRASAWYRRHLVRVLTARLLTERMMRDARRA